MLELLLTLSPIIIVDAMNPVLAAAAIFALGTRKPYRAAFWVLFGWFVVYFLAGIGLAVGLERITRALANPRQIDFAIQTPIALAMIWFAYKSARDSEQSKANKHVPQAGGSSHALGAFSGILLGATITVVGLPFALPYFAAIDQVLKADLSAGRAVWALALYNLAYILPFATLVLLRFIYRDQADALFGRINAWMEKSSAVIMPIMLFLIGAVLLVDTVLYFTTGNPLINITPPAG
jgi:threonine/homoserine/homoserine lactone efflux protein